jgi:hypothetical protein
MKSGDRPQEGKEADQPQQGEPMDQSKTLLKKQLSGTSAQLSVNSF